LAAFAERKPITINGKNFSVINKLEHEDGSGHSFNVTVFRFNRNDTFAGVS
jgi:hypothetical protein